MGDQPATAIEYPGQPRLLMLLKAARGFHLLDVRKVVRVEADTRYAVLFLVDGSNLPVFHNLAELEVMLNCGERLQDLLFLRIHRSHIVAFHHVVKIEGRQLELNDGTCIHASRKLWSSITATAMSIRPAQNVVHDT